MPCVSQSPPSASRTTGTTQPVRSWTPPKTSWGDPDLQGMWPGTDLLGTPLQRDPKLGTHALLNDDEYARKEARAKLVGDDAQDLPGNIGSPIWWLERGKPTRQASLIVEPPDGRIPPLTREAIKLGEARDARFHLTYGVERKGHGSKASWIEVVLALVDPY